MKRRPSEPRLIRHALLKGVAVVGLAAMAGLALAGPSGLVAWGRDQRLLETRQAQLAQAERARDELRNRVDLLDARHADPDLAGELVRSRLNVAHPDEMVMVLH